MYNGEKLQQIHNVITSSEYIYKCMYMHTYVCNICIVLYIYIVLGVNALWKLPWTSTQRDLLDK